MIPLLISMAIVLLTLKSSFRFLLKPRAPHYEGMISAKTKWYAIPLCTGIPYHSKVVWYTVSRTRLFRHHAYNEIRSTPPSGRVGSARPGGGSPPSGLVGSARLAGGTPPKRARRFRSSWGGYPPQADVHAELVLGGVPPQNDIGKNSSWGGSPPQADIRK